MTHHVNEATRIDEVADDIFRISTRIAADFGSFTFNRFLVRGEDALLFHSGPRGLASDTIAAIQAVMPIARLRHVAFSHVEADECGALNPLLAAAPVAVPACSQVGAMVSIGDLADRPPRPLASGDVLETGRHRLRFIATPHLPHGWDSGLFFEETTATLLCGDLLTQPGDPPPLVETDLVESSEAFRREMDYYANHALAASQIRELAALAPRTLATMHGSSFRGDAAAQLRALASSVESG